jgi:DNA polymerase/3'-5' exonuclease PolX
MSGEKKMPLFQAESVAVRFINLVTPHCLKVSIAGSVRRKCEEVGDIEIVVVPRDEMALDILFPEGYPGIVVNGSRLKRFKYPQYDLQLELYITNLNDYGRILAIRTGSSAFSHLALASAWNRMGWCGTSEGLRRKKQCLHKGTIWKIKPECKDNIEKPPAFETEEAFFNFLNMPFVPPEKRNWVSKKHEEYNY